MLLEVLGLTALTAVVGHAAAATRPRRPAPCDGPPVRAPEDAT
ncbi:hypothetical protein GCM10023113_10770 [Cellulomonas oligotrophica]|nr:hypothetical protein Col01nite_03510 [Cellulomonas oligotrophica]